jgi:hypothetical protein
MVRTQSLRAPAPGRNTATLLGILQHIVTARNFSYDATIEEDNVNEEAKRAYNHAYYLANRDNLRAHSKRWQQENADKRRLSQQKFRRENLDLMREREKIYRKNNRDKVNARGRRYFHNNRALVKNLQRKTIYGITSEQWDALFMAQGSVCAICSNDKPGHKNGWSTDHDHETGAVRGVLCHSCNVTLGYYEKKIIPSLSRLTQYLIQHKLVGGPSQTPHAGLRRRGP